MGSGSSIFSVAPPDPAQQQPQSQGSSQSLHWGHTHSSQEPGACSGVGRDWACGGSGSNHYPQNWSDSSSQRWSHSRKRPKEGMTLGTGVGTLEHTLWIFWMYLGHFGRPGNATAFAGRTCWSLVSPPKLNENNEIL